MEKLNYSPYASNKKNVSNCNTIKEEYNNYVLYYSFWTIIGITFSGKTIITDKYYSVTTSKHKNHIRRDSCNYSEIPHETFREIRKVFTTCTNSDSIDKKRVFKYLISTLNN